MKKLYVGIDLHSTNNVLGISDEDDQKILWLQMSVGHVKSACYGDAHAILYQHARSFPLG